MVDQNSKNLSYIRTLLFQTEQFEVVSIRWNQQSVSPPHDHGWSQCSVLIQSGLFEDRMDLGFKTEIKILEAGQVIHTPVGAKHEIRCLSEKGETLHVYTPKVSSGPEVAQFKITLSENFETRITLDTSSTSNELKTLLDLVRKNSITTQSPYFMNQLFSGVSAPMLMAEALISQTKTTMATAEASPAFSAIESEVIDALGRQIGWLANECDGVTVPGGSAANFMALHCARHQKFPDLKKQGLGAQRFQIFVSSDAHYSFQKASVALGIGSDNVCLIAVDDRGRMIPAELEKAIRSSKESGAIPLLVCATAGTTVRGAFDPIDELAEICKLHQVWLHVDGAWGGPAIFSDALKAEIRGIELADSVTFDAHKLFGASLTCSFLLTRHRGLLLEANDVSGADYLFHNDHPALDRGKTSWQCGRRADAVSFWTIWKSVGTKGLGAFVDRLIAVRNETLDWIKAQPRLQLVAEPDYLNICVRVKPPHANEDPKLWSQKVREKMKEKNLAMVNFASDSQGTFLRMILAHPYLELKHTRQILEWAQGIE